jgi:hypothetical protein
MASKKRAATCAAHTRAGARPLRENDVWASAGRQLQNLAEDVLLGRLQGASSGQFVTILHRISQQGSRGVFESFEPKKRLETGNNFNL